MYYKPKRRFVSFYFISSLLYYLVLWIWKDDLWGSVALVKSHISNLNHLLYCKLVFRNMFRNSMAHIPMLIFRNIFCTRDYLFLFLILFLFQVWDLVLRWTFELKVQFFVFFFWFFDVCIYESLTVLVLLRVSILILVDDPQIRWIINYERCPPMDSCAYIIWFLQ